MSWGISTAISIKESDTPQESLNTPDCRTTSAARAKTTGSKT